MTTHRDEALKALDHVIDRLASPEPIDGLSKYQLKASLEFAREEIGRVQEVKRPRKVKDPT
jgi:hypothetical protein